MMRIALSGLDGTGKSTLVSELEKHFKEQGKRVKMFHLFSKGQTVMARAQDSGLLRGLVKWIRGRKDGFFGRGLKFWARFINVIIDSYITQRRNNQLALDVILYDRYFYDVLLAVIRDFPEKKSLAYAVGRRLPRPDHVFFLDAKPETVIARKPEHTLESAQLYRSLYREMAEVLNISILDAEQPEKNVLEQALKQCDPGSQANVTTI
ncbi:MAG: hypothetical protein G3M70_04505 [Candidatus Nitronauta litoralis]|uniref:Thymidylate kinase-like domain-containing protein n=1 Tax=Candidatus Nitronauta litoralis TaxID=2705533 RepID=A0A7T0FZT6_9BACT|nr:MAG: hypothetical protein G3M70_04505 [Candidatus Nitronauta litoralis]